MANTARGYPYPLSSDPVAQGAQAIQNLAQAVNDKAGVSASGTANVNITSLNTGVTVTVTFPAGRFTAAPIPIACSSGAFQHPENVHVTAGSATATSMTIGASRSAGTIASVSVFWMAIQI